MKGSQKAAKVGLSGTNAIVRRRWTPKTTGILPFDRRLWL